MRYYLLLYEDNFYIVNASELSTLEAALCMIATPIASIHSRSAAIAYKFLVLHAIAYHQNKYKKESGK